MSYIPELDFIERRSQWLEEHSAKEGDVMVDDDGSEYIATSNESDHSDTYQITYGSERLPEDIQLKN